MTTKYWKIKKDTRVVYINMYKSDTQKIDTLKIDTMKTTTNYFFEHVQSLERDNDEPP